MGRWYGTAWGRSGANSSEFERVIHLDRYLTSTSLCRGEEDKMIWGNHFNGFSKVLKRLAYCLFTQDTALRRGANERYDHL